MRYRLLATSVLTACTVSVSGGVIGALASMGAFALFALLAGGAQTGCAEDAPAPDDAEVPQVDFGPCLTIDQYIPEDASVIGPCLGAPLEDLGSPDAGLDQGALDMRVEDARRPDLEVGPCLDTPLEPEPEPPPGKAMAPGSIDRAALFAKVTAGLPTDVAARLVRPDDSV